MFSYDLEKLLKNIKNFKRVIVNRYKNWELYFKRKNLIEFFYSKMRTKRTSTQEDFSLLLQSAENILTYP